MEELVLALAVDNENRISSGHFGDSPMFAIYRVNQNKADLIKKIENTTDDESHGSHGEMHKAMQIKAMLNIHGVQVLAGKVFGENIRNMKKHFVCIFLNEKNEESATNILKSRFIKIKESWDMGAERNHLNFKL